MLALSPPLQEDLDNVVVFPNDDVVTFDHWRNLLRFLHGLSISAGTGDIKSDGSVNFTASQSWVNGANILVVSPTGINAQSAAATQGYFSSASISITGAGVISEITAAGFHASNGTAESFINIGGTASFTDGGGNTVSIAPVAGIRVMNGAVGTPSHSFTSQTDMGVYKISATQLGFSVSGILQGGFNTGGFFTGVISEQIVSGGVGIAGTAGTLILMQDIVNTAYVLVPASSIDHACFNFDPTGLDPTTPNEGDMWYDSVDRGFSFQGNAGDAHITLIPDVGWRLHTGTGSKADFDADWTQSISAVPTQAEVEAVRDQVIAVQKALAGIQDHLMTNMNLLQA